MGDRQPAPPNGARIALSPPVLRCTRRRRPGSSCCRAASGGRGPRNSARNPTPAAIRGRSGSDQGSPRVAPRAGDSQFELRTVLPCRSLLRRRDFFFSLGALFFFFRPRTRLISRQEWSSFVRGGFEFDRAETLALLVSLASESESWELVALGALPALYLLVILVSNLQRLASDCAVPQFRDLCICSLRGFTADS